MTTQTSPRLGWIGLGSMGIAMAKNLQRHVASCGLPALRYTNRTMSRGASLEGLGGVPCDSIAELLRDTDIVFISMSDDDALGATVSIMLESEDIRDKIIVDTTTVHPDTSVRACVDLKTVGATFIAAPVFGPSPVAEGAELLIAVAGPPTAVKTILPFLNILGRAVVELGEEVRKATLLKTAGNFVVAGIMEVVAEAQVFAEKTGLGTECLEKLLEMNFGPETYGASRRMTSGSYAPPKGTRPQSDVALAVKDVRHGISCAEQAGTRLKVAEVALEHLVMAQAYAAENERSLDSTSMFGILRQDAGLEFESDVVKADFREAR